MIRHLWGLRKGDRVVVYVDGKYYCDACKKPLNSSCIHYFNPRMYNKKGKIGEFAFCHYCFLSLPGEYKEGYPHLNIATVAPIPSQAFQIHSPVTITHSNRTSWEVMESECVDTRNRCKYAGHPGYTLEPNVQIGKSVEQLEIEQLKEQEELDTLAIDGYLGQFMPTIEDKTEKLKQIEEKK